MLILQVWRQVSEVDIQGMDKWSHPPIFYGMISLIHALDTCFGPQSSHILELSEFTCGWSKLFAFHGILNASHQIYCFTDCNQWETALLCNDASSLVGCKQKYQSCGSARHMSLCHYRTVRFFLPCQGWWGLLLTWINFNSSMDM